MPNPRQLNGTWVSDVADLLSPTSENQLNQLISELEATNGAEIAVVTVPNTQPSPTPKAFATELFNAWGIGKAGVDNGVLFLVSKGDRRTEVETGYGVEAVLPDAKVGDILRNQVTPRFKEGDFDAGILAGTEAIATALRSEPFVATSSTSNGVSNGVGNGAIATPASGPLSGIVGQVIGGLAMLAAAIAAGLRVLKLRAIRIANPEAGTGAAIIRASRLTIAPTGHTRWPNDNRSSGWVNKILFWLVGEEPLLKNASSELFLAKRPLNYSKTWWKALIGLYISFWIVPVILTVTVPSGFLLLFSLNIIGPLVFLLWLSLEIGRSAPNTPEGHTTYVGRAFLIFILGGMLCLFTNGLLLPVVGASAITLCLRRRARRPYSVLCESCIKPMEVVPETEIRSRLSEAQQVAQKLGSTVHQAWCCNSCQSQQQPQHGFDIHLFSQVVDAEEFAHCSTCDAHTVVSTSRIETHATTSSSGTRLITSTCRCCKNVTQKRTTIPRKSSSSGSASGGYSGGYSSGGYDSGGGGGYDGGGGSFGGGSSGGGGGGDSW